VLKLIVRGCILTSIHRTCNNLHRQAIIVEIISTTWWHFLIASIFAGLSSGFVGTSVTTYASEIAMPQMRGAALSAYAFSFALGQLAAAIGLQIIAVVSRRLQY
jgi:MFS family permease